MQIQKDKMYAMLRKGMFGLFVVLDLFALKACSGPEDPQETPVQQSNRIIDFSGHQWLVRNSNNDKQGPGPNYFLDSEENVWVDDEGRLHLKIIKKEGIWYCSGISLLWSHGYNKYVMYASSRLDQIDENAVAGFFVYGNDTEEIDIEFSKWSKTENDNSQFAVQPSSVVDNKFRFNMEMENGLSTHFFDWKPDRIEFASFNGHVDVSLEEPLNHWVYKGADIPPDKEERLKINLWLFKGSSPSNNQEVEIIIDRIEIL
ncbi:hypothetical protein B4Q04_21115 [Zobellia sp. OII3]|nr:hypothetical protein B4Q04_21115 [Zobellia sp. OII3]